MNGRTILGSVLVAGAALALPLRATQPEQVKLLPGYVDLDELGGERRPVGGKGERDVPLASMEDADRQPAADACHVERSRAVRERDEHEAADEPAASHEREAVVGGDIRAGDEPEFTGDASIGRAGRARAAGWGAVG